MTDKCHCGFPLHYTDKKIYQYMQQLVDNFGPNIHVYARGKTYSVPRHYIALHGLKETELPFLGFKEIS